MEQRGMCIWLTGLPGAGKSTLGQQLADELEENGLAVDVLDGDEVRHFLSPSLGFSREERDINVRRLGWMASRLVRAGMSVVVASISPYRDARAEARALVEPFGPFVEIHVDAPAEVCAARDPKGLYARARRGEISGFTGVDDPYEPPRYPDVRVATATLDADACMDVIRAELGARGLLFVAAQEAAG